MKHSLPILKTEIKNAKIQIPMLSGADKSQNVVGSKYSNEHHDLSYYSTTK